MVIRCDSCAARYRIPPTTVGERGAQVKCPECAATIVVFPTDDVSMVTGVEPPTMDWIPLEVLPVTEPDRIPNAIRALFAGEQVHPPGTEPPVQHREHIPPRVVGRMDAALSVTPPPPRTVRQPRFNPAGLHTIPPPALPEDVSLHTSPPPRRTVRDSDRNTAPAALGRFTHGGAPPRSIHSAVTQAPAGERASFGGGYPTAPNQGNRTGPTGGGTPPRATYASVTEVSEGMSYAPPWGAPGWNTAPPAPAAGQPASYGGPLNGTPSAAPWQAPWAPLPPGVHTHPGAPVTSYGAWATGQPAPSNQGPPVVTTWQPQWMPAVVLGMERTTLAMLLAVVLVVGFVGSCLGVGSGTVATGFTESLRPAPVVAIPGTAPPEAPATTQAVVSPPAVPEAAAPLPNPRPLPVAGSKVAPWKLKLPPMPVPGDPVAAPPPPASAPFDVDASDVRDPWAEL